MPKTFYISTAIAYVNGPPHIGHALEFTEEDCIARYHRLIGDDVYCLTGTDEHGSKIVQTAEELGVPVKKLVDKNAQLFKEMMALYQISYDQFIRTSDKKVHWPSVQKLWERMAKNGDIYKGEYRGLYCVGCEEYKNEKDLIDGNCPNHDKRPDIVEQENYFFRLSKYSDQIAEILKSQQVKIVPEFRANEIIAMCERGLEDVSFSRPKEQLSWGIPVPDDDSQVMYVWCDALANYLSALDYAHEGPNYQKYWPADCHVIGKDILRFHAGVWIGMLLSAGLPLPKSELVHGWIHFQGGRMSKSAGNVVDPVELAEHYGVDAARYFLLAEIPVGQDGNFSFELFENKINADLANNLGNFVNRVLSMTERYLDGVVPAHKQDIPSEVDDLWQQYHAAFADYDHQQAAAAMIQLVDYGNKLIADTKPWELSKEHEGTEAGKLDRHQGEELGIILRRLLKIVLHLAFMLEPFCPNKAKQIGQCFGLQQKLNAEGLEALQENQLLDQVKKVKKGGLLFERIEAEKSLIDQDVKTIELPQIPIPVTPEAQKLNLPVVSFVMTDLKPIGTAVQKRLKKKWRIWLEALRNRPAKEQKQVEVILQKAYDLNQSLGVGSEETPGNTLVHQFLMDEDKEFPFINPLVALYNFVEAKYGLSLGAHDVDKLNGDVQLKICDGSEDYLPLDATGPKKVPRGTYAYSDTDGTRVICWLEVKQCQQTGVDAKTTDVLFLLQGYKGVSQEYVQQAADELKALVEEWL